MQEDVSDVTMATFGLLRSPASQLMTLPSIGASNAREATRYLGSIHAILTAMPDPELHLTKQLIAYIQHALNHVLFLCQNFMQLSKRFDFLVESWCKCLEFLLRLPDGYAFVVGANWRYSRLLFEILFRALDGLPIRNEQQSSSSSKQQVLDPTKVPKDRMPDETRLAALRCLILTLPLDKSVPTIDQFTHDTDMDEKALLNNDRSFRTNKDKEVQGHLLEPSSKATLGQMLVILLNTAKDADLIALRKTALEGILKLLKCLETPERVAAWFPGVSAGLTESMLKRGLKENHSVLSEALYTWTYMVILILQDSTLPNSQLAEAASGGSGLGEALMNMYKGKQRPLDDEKPGVPSPSPQPGYGSKEWMTKTNHGLKTLFKQIAPLRSHSHWKVRFQFGDMAFRILRDCQRSIAHRSSSTKSSGVACFLLETLIGCTQDDYKDVYQPARSYLGQLTEKYMSLELTNLGKEILRERLIALPRVLHGADETVKQNSIRLSQGLVLFLGNQMDSMVNHQNLLTYIQPWINILAIEQLDQHNMDERGGILSDGFASKDIDSENLARRWNAWVQSHKGSGRKFGFPRRIHVHLREQSTSNAFIGFLRQMGSTTDISIWTEELMSRLQQDCRNVRENQGWFDSGSVSCVLMMNQLLLGAHGVGLATFGDLYIGAVSEKAKSKNSLLKKRQRHVRRAARGVLEEYLAALMECSQMSLDAKLRNEAERSSVPLAERSARDKKLMLAKLLGMEEEGFDIEQTEAQIYDYNTDVMLQCLLLEGIASAAIVLGGAEFEMELVRVLYILLEHLGDQDSALVRDTAEAALEHVAFICQYDSIGDLIQANYDYVIQQVSQKIAFLGSNPKTPQVLWALIRVVGPPAISMLEDSVTEIFEALDHWKNQEDQVAEGLLKSLCEIVRVMSQATPVSQSKGLTDGGAKSKRDSGVLMSPGFEFSLPTEPSKEVENFARTYRIMIQGVDETTDEDAEKLRKDTENMSPEEIKDYFMNLTKEAKEEEERRLGEQDLSEDTDKDEDEDEMSFGDLRAKMPKPSKESQPEPPTKHQALCLRILNKAGYFLTASSPRMRILALETIQSSIVVLKDRPQDLNPAIHAFWPSIVGRVLKRSEKDVFYVSLRAIEVVTLLAENCSDFLGRHLLDDIWPFILRALRSWTRPITSGAKGNNKARILGKTIRYGQGADSASSHNQPRSQGRREAAAKVFTQEHRLQMTTLESVSKIVRKVRIPVQEMWEMLLLARDMMLDTNWAFHWDVRLAASEVIKSMAVAGHGDSVFLVLDEIVGHDCSGPSDDSSDENAEGEDEATKMCSDILSFMSDENL
ncbi:TEL2-interacting protein 1 [Mortierella sp. AD011]|nr:TEL2-interacting protein 1 [Mortierella sp. AD011]